jgi:hypothetical protein
MAIVYFFSSTLLVHAFAMHEQTTSSHDTMTAQMTHGDCGGMNDQEDSSDKDCASACLDMAQQDATYHAIKEECHTVCYHSSLIIDRRAIDTLFSPVVYEDV